MGYETIRYEVKDGVATITLNRLRPTTRSIWPGERSLPRRPRGRRGPRRALHRRYGRGEGLLRGRDVKDFNDNADRIGVVIKELTTYLHGAVSRLARSAKPVIMAVNGVAAGGA